MAEIAEMGDAPAVYLDHKNRILATLQPFGIVVVNAHIVNLGVLDLLIDNGPVGLRALALEAAQDLRRFMILERNRARVVGMVMTDADYIDFGQFFIATVLRDRVRIEGDARPLAGR